MQVLIFEDENGYKLEPYSDEPLDAYWVCDEGRDRPWTAGWRPYKMPQVSRTLFTELWLKSWIRHWSHRPYGTWKNKKQISAAYEATTPR